ncbi:hypothetical protein ACTRXD_08385 [Nitrospira sp. T9]|uniref:hypothetical protein n=1 Tax=unclassified Nitrospira TaxID=2652172 RepID=UPI003F9A784F
MSSKPLNLLMMPHHLKLPSMILAVAYIALASIATYCVTSHEIQHSSINHHSKHTSSHSSLCSWACQVSSKANPADTTQNALFTLTLSVVGVVFLFFVIPTQTTLSPTLARGPPV